ncbi:glycosyltransferase family 4 protein [Odoribacter lunatus]|uniref:glycosyltransferase family 4 protein n=1 Tax=Odoribacter lunatus TaxID=2941335 RepID=UPI00203BE422|nr:glycosyltransferase family 4 protein [Odoribacter lunatus]
MITHAFLPDIDGGVIVAYDYANLLVKQGHKVTVLSKKYRNPLTNTLFKYVQVPNRYGSYFWKYNFGCFLHKMNIEEYDFIILNQSPTPIIAGAYFPEKVLKKTIPIIQGLEVEYIYRNRKFLSNLFHIFLRFKPLHKKCLLACKKVISVSEFHKQKVIEAAKLESISSKFQVVYTGIDKDIFKPILSDFRDKFGVYHKEILITVARIEKMKGFSEMLGIFQRLTAISKDYLWVIIGDGSYMLELKEEIRQNNLDNSVMLLGRKKREELGYYYSAANCFWLLSNYDECLPLVYLEAQSCGIPAVGRNKGGTKETILHNKTGFLIDSEEECLDILLNQRYKQIKSSDLKIFSDRFDKTEAVKQLIS